MHSTHTTVPFSICRHQSYTNLVWVQHSQLIYPHSLATVPFGLGNGCIGDVTAQDCKNTILAQSEIQPHLWQLSKPNQTKPPEKCSSSQDTPAVWMESMTLYCGNGQKVVHAAYQMFDQSQRPKPHVGPCGATCCHRRPLDLQARYATPHCGKGVPQAMLTSY